MEPLLLRNKALALILLACACAQAFSVRDARNVDVQIRQSPQRVVVLNNSLLNLWYECGGTAVGRVEANSAPIPAQALTVPMVGGMTTPSAERILALRPDLVLAYHGMDAHDRLIPALQGSGVAVLSLENETLDDYLRLSRQFYKILGKDTLHPRPLWKNVLDTVNVIRGQEHAGKAPQVLILFGSPKDVSVRTEDSHVGSMVRDLGGVNIAKGFPIKSEGYATFSLERVVAQDPDVILVQCMGDEKAIAERIHKQFASNPAWTNLRAVREKRYFILPKDLFLYKPNAHWPEAYRKMEKLLYNTP